MSEHRAYYNEIDPYAAQWLRNLITAGHITAGEVDTRSIVDVRPADLVGFTRCHFFAGIGVWDYALNLAGWGGRPVWTGSCPCQPFSAAGRQRGVHDERHLWPVWFDLIRECGPEAVLGEQVEAAVRLGWLDAVFSDLEGEGYACGAVVLGAHSVGAPHIRQRLWFVADAAGEGWRPERSRRDPGECAEEAFGGATQSGRCGATGLMADPSSAGLRHAEDAGADRGHSGALQGGGQGQSGLREPQRGGAAGVLGDAERIGVRGSGRGPDAGAAGGVPDPHGQRQWLRTESGAAGATSAVGVAAGVGCERFGDEPKDIEPLPADESSSPWADLEWLTCRDGKARPTQPGLQPLAHGATSRVGRLRAYGNAIVAPVAAEFVQAVLDVRP